MPKQFNNKFKVNNKILRDVLLNTAKKEGISVRKLCARIGIDPSTVTRLGYGRSFNTNSYVSVLAYLFPSDNGINGLYPWVEPVDA